MGHAIIRPVSVVNKEAVIVVAGLGFDSGLITSDTVTVKLINM